MTETSESWPPPECGAVEISRRLQAFGIHFAVAIATEEVLIKPWTVENVQLVRDAVDPLKLEVHEWVGPLPQRY